MAAIVSDWLVPWPEPGRYRGVPRLPVKVLPGYSVALIVSGVIAPLVLNPTQINEKFESRWHQGWSEPRRDRVVNRAAIVSFAAGPFSPPWHLPETSNEIRGWFQALQTPVWPKKGLRIYLQQFFITAPVRYLPNPDVTATIHAHDPPVTDTAEFLTWAYFEPPVAADQEGAKVSITEV